MRSWAYRHPNVMCLLWAAIWVVAAFTNPTDAWSWQWWAWVVMISLVPLRRAGYWYGKTGGPS